METGRRSAASDVAVARRPDASGPSTPRCSSYSKFLLMWSAGEAVAVVVYLFAGRVWGFVVAGVLFTLGCLFTCYYINLPGQEPPPLPVAAAAGSGGLSQEDIEAIPAFEYRRRREETASADAGAEAAVDEECAVCISVVRDGETVRRLPACGHVYHARCINGWLRAHTSCPMCRAPVKVVAGEPSAGAAV